MLGTSAVAAAAAAATARGLTCIAGFVNVIPTGLIGAAHGTITPLFGTPIPFTQVVGPAGGAISVNALEGQFALLCGQFVYSRTGVALNVSAAVPLGAGPGAAGAVPGSIGLGLHG